jgi:putative RecB family exonuclease
MPLSYSQLSTYRRCPRQFEYAFKKKIPRQISTGESFGSSAHLALKKWGEGEISGQKSVVSDQLLLFGEEYSPDPCPLTSDHLLDLWRSSFIVEGYESRAAADAAALRGEDMMRHFYEWWGEKERSVLAIEKGFSIVVDGTKVSGRFDRVENEGDGVHIIDFKTSAPRTQDETDADLQLSLYALASEETFGKPCTKLSFLFIHEEGVVERSTVRTPGQLQDARRQMQLMHEQMEEGDFHPTPSREKCKKCPYSRVCDAAAV